MPQSELTVPDGAREGDVLHVNTPDGLAVDVAIPAGVAAGETFVFEYELPQPPPPDETMLMAAVRARRLRRKERLGAAGENEDPEEAARVRAAALDALANAEMAQGEADLFDMLPRAFM